MTTTTYASPTDYFASKTIEINQYITQVASLDMAGQLSLQKIIQDTTAQVGSVYDSWIYGSDEAPSTSNEVSEKTASLHPSLIYYYERLSVLKELIEDQLFYLKQAASLDEETRNALIYHFEDVVNGRLNQPFYYTEEEIEVRREYLEKLRDNLFTNQDYVDWKETHATGLDNFEVFRRTYPSSEGEQLTIPDDILLACMAGTDKEKADRLTKLKEVAENPGRFLLNELEEAIDMNVLTDWIPPLNKTDYDDKLNFLSFLCPGKPFKGLRIRFPGNTLKLEFPVIPEFISSAKEQMKKFFDFINQIISIALIPLGPIFAIFEWVSEVIKAIEALGDGDPDKVREAILELSQKTAEVVNVFFPQATIPLLVMDIICVIGQILLNFINLIDDIITEAQQLTMINDLIPDFPHVQNDYDELECIIKLKQSGMGQALGMLNSQIDIVNGFASMADVAIIPKAEDLDWSDLLTVKTQLQSYRAMLGEIPTTCLI